MARAQRSKLAIGHVLFIDIVGYSKLSTEEQSEALVDLNRVVRATEAVRATEGTEQLLVLPTGDGMALVFSGSIEEPVECALQVAQALKAQPSPSVRMGVHSGPVHHVPDVNGRANLAGAGINIAQRVMDSGDAGHILISKRVADDLAQYRRWQPYLHELGDCEVKHGVVISLSNLYADALGNPSWPAKLVPGNSSAASKAKKRLSLTLRLGLVLMSAVALFVVLIWQYRDRRGTDFTTIDRSGPTVRPSQAPAQTKSDLTPTPVGDQEPTPANSLPTSEAAPSIIPLRVFSGGWSSVNSSPIASKGTLTVQDQLRISNSAIEETITTEWFAENTTVYRIQLRVRFGELWTFQNQLNARCLAADVIDVFDPKGFGTYANMTEQTASAAKAGVSLVYTWRLTGGELRRGGMTWTRSK